MRKTKMIRSGNSFLFISDEPLTPAEQIAAEYLMRPLEDPPRFLSSPPVVDGPEYVEPIRFIAGWVVVLAVFGLIWIGV